MFVSSIVVTANKDLSSKRALIECSTVHSPQLDFQAVLFNSSLLYADNETFYLTAPMQDMEQVSETFIEDQIQVPTSDYRGSEMRAAKHIKQVKHLEAFRWRNKTIPRS